MISKNIEKLRKKEIYMKIYQKKIKEIYCKVRRTIAKDERFYAVPGAKDYVVSTYCRVFQLKHGHWYKNIKPLGYDYYIKYDNEVCKKRISINVLSARVFFPHIRGGYMETSHQFNGWQAWKIENMHLCVGGDMIAEAIRAKIEHREPTYSDEYKHHQFINRFETESINKYLNAVYRNMKTRSTNKGWKTRFPIYSKTTICNNWKDNPDVFKQWVLDNQYFYPDKLELDKDILGFGKTNEYNEHNCCFVPRYINDIFTCSKSRLCYNISSTTLKSGNMVYIIPKHAFGGSESKLKFDNYSDALKAGRKRKANYIRDVVKKERKRGFIPDYILDAMLKWATLCECGLIKQLEPTIETVLEEAG